MLRILELLKTPGALLAFLTWPKFSLAAFQIISRAKLAGIQPQTVVDVGANIGQFAVASSRLFQGAEVFPVEPDPQVAEQLRKNVGLPVARNIRVTAVGDSVGNATFHVNRDPQVSSLLPLGKDRIESFPGSSVVGEITVPVTTLDVLFDGIALAEPILLKIDVQGFEDRVIAGAGVFLKRVRWVLMEVSFSQLYEGERDFEAMVELLRKHGFRFVRPMNFHISPKTGEIIEMDALFEATR
ncbi:MAG: FkbM family methyltransferase [Sulfuritalea sp.]|nr:FkbM family methyltransferase [Sulfuritalea sp.]